MYIPRNSRTGASPESYPGNLLSVFIEFYFKNNFCNDVDDHKILFRAIFGKLASLLCFLKDLLECKWQMLYLVWFYWVWFRFIGFGLVWGLWHINHCRLFNAKSSLYIHIKYISFGLVGFYGLSTIVGYLMLNPPHTYKLESMICKHFVDNIFKRAWAHLFAHS